MPKDSDAAPTVITTREWWLSSTGVRSIQCPWLPSLGPKSSSLEKNIPQFWELGHQHCSKSHGRRGDPWQTTVLELRQEKQSCSNVEAATHGQECSGPLSCSQWPRIPDRITQTRPLWLPMLVYLQIRTPERNPTFVQSVFIQSSIETMAWVPLLIWLQFYKKGSNSMKFFW